MKNEDKKPIFVGPSIGVSLLCFIPLCCLKMFGILDISWVWITSPLWFGWVAVFLVWIWFSTINIVCKTIEKISMLKAENDFYSKIEVKKEDQNGM